MGLTAGFRFRGLGIREFGFADSEDFGIWLLRRMSLMIGFCTNVGT